MSARWLALAAAVAALVAPRLAAANPGGVAGYTGKPTAGAPAGESCNKCHSGGAAPQVAITGPTSLAPSQAGDYAIVVTTPQSRASGAVAATDGVALVPVSGLRDSFGELVQTGSQPAGGGAVQLRFRATAPAKGGSFDLFAVGLASNGSGTGGDRAAHAKITVTVTGGGASGGADAGAQAPSPDGRDAGARGDGGATAGDAGEADDDGDDEPSDPTAPARPGWERTSGASCAAGAGAPRASAAWALVLLGIVSLAARRARRAEAAIAAATLAIAGCGGAGPSSGDEEATGGAAGGAAAKVDPTEGRDATATSCFAACQGAAFVCRTQRGEARTSSRAELAAEPTGCAGALIAGGATTPITLDCVERRACVGGGAAPTCAPATFGALSFAYASGGATTTCTRVVD